MSHDSDPYDSEIPGDVLPPVEPPSAGFILQLFVVPGIIVVIIVSVWLLFHWVARAGSDPQADVEALKRDSANRWQAAVSLANALGDPTTEGVTLRQDAHLAEELGAILQAEIEAGSMKKDPILLRYFLCKALSKFDTPAALPALLKAAGTQRAEEEVEVQLAALEAIAVLSENVVQAHPGETIVTPEVEEVLLKTSSDDNPRVRGTAALVLGVVGGEKLLGRLVALLADSNPDVRYNAATRLAARGESQAVPVLADMLDPDETAGVDMEPEKKLRPPKRALLVTNALVATEQLLKANPQADFAPIREQLDRLLAAEKQKRENPKEKKSPDEEEDPRDVPLPKHLDAHAARVLEHLPAAAR